MQKSGSGDHPADSAGATIDIISKPPAAEEFEGKLSVSLGTNESTGHKEEIQKTQGSESFGYGSNDRSLGRDAKLLSASPLSPDLAGLKATSLLDLSQLKTEKKRLSPDQSI